jgi:hypothetical protein
VSGKLLEASQALLALIDRRIAAALDRDGRTCCEFMQELVHIQTMLASRPPLDLPIVQSAERSGQINRPNRLCRRRALWCHPILRIWPLTRF